MRGHDGGEIQKRMKIGLIDVDGHNFPNLALTRISAYHKSKGDFVEWWWSDFVHYDIVYMSKIFSDEYSSGVPEPVNADKVIKGGTGYAIHIVNGKEVFDKENHKDLPPEIEKCFPDYSIYPQFDFAVSMTSRGCPRGCDFCHVAAKEGKCSLKVADVKDFWNGQKEIKILDPNVTACSEKRDLFKQYQETKALLDFTQGLDIRLLNDADMSDLEQMRLKNVHFAWDNPNLDLSKKFLEYTKTGKKNKHGKFGTVYILTNFDSSIQEDLYRIYTVRDLGYSPYVMVYNKPSAPKEVKRIQRWCNNKKIFNSEPDFKKYVG